MPLRLPWKMNDMDPRKGISESDVRKYLDLRLEDLKLRTVDGLSVGVSRVLAVMVLLMLGAIVLAAFAFGTVLLLGDVIGSQAGAAFIIGGVFLIVLVVILLVWRKLFVNIFVKLFIDIFYGNE